jgi:hypothetical protein
LEFLRLQAEEEVNNYPTLPYSPTHGFLLEDVDLAYEN